MAERIYLQLFHSDVPGAVPTAGLKIGELGLNVADNLQFVGYGGDVNYDINGDPLPDLPPEGMGWKTVGIGGGGPPGPPGPEGAGVPPGGDFGQYLRKAAEGDYVTVWDDGPPPADRDERGLVYAVTSGSVPNNNVTLGYLSTDDNGNQNTTALGWSAGSLATGTRDNVFVGYRSGYNIDGNRNVVLGSEAAGSNAGGGATSNVVIGYQSGYNVTSANFNTLIGPTAGYNIRTGDNNTIIGGYDGSSDIQGNVVLSDGQGTIRFQANDTGAWSPDGLDYGQPGYLLTSNGPDEAPEWKEAPLALVSQIIAGENVTIFPPDGLGVVTINASGGGGGTSNINSLTSGDGVTLLNASGVPVPVLTGPGTISINSTEVLTPGLYTEAGSILIGGFGSGGVASLSPGTSGQVLTISPSTGFPYWANPTGTNPATPTVAGIVYGRTDGGLSKNVTLGLNAGAALLGGGTANVFIGTAAGSNVNTGDNNVIIGNFAGTSNLQGNIVLADGAGNIRLQTNSTGALRLRSVFPRPRSGSRVGFQHQCPDPDDLGRCGHLGHSEWDERRDRQHWCDLPPRRHRNHRSEHRWWCVAGEHRSHRWSQQDHRWRQRLHLPDHWCRRGHHLRNRWRWWRKHHQHHWWNRHQHPVADRSSRYGEQHWRHSSGGRKQRHPVR